MKAIVPPHPDDANPRRRREQTRQPGDFRTKTEKRHADLHAGMEDASELQRVALVREPIVELAHAVLVGRVVDVHLDGKRRGFWCR